MVCFSCCETVLLLASSVRPLMDEAVHPLMDEAIRPLMDEAVHPLMDEAVHPLLDEAVHPLMDEAIHPLMDEAKLLMGETGDRKNWVLLCWPGPCPGPSYLLMGGVVLPPL